MIMPNYSSPMHSPTSINSTRSVSSSTPLYTILLPCLPLELLVLKFTWWERNRRKSWRKLKRKEEEMEEPKRSGKWVVLFLHQVEYGWIRRFIQVTIFQEIPLKENKQSNMCRKNGRCFLHFLAQCLVLGYIYGNIVWALYVLLNQLWVIWVF